LSGELEDFGRFLDLERFQTVVCLQTGHGDLPDLSARARQLRQFDLLEVVSDVAPGVLARVLGDALEQQRQRLSATWAWIRCGAQ
jgi:hypothetical protein